MDSSPDGLTGYIRSSIFRDCSPQVSPCLCSSADQNSLRWPPTRTIFLWASLGLLAVAVVMNLIGLNIGKWLQNAGGVSTYAPLLMLIGIGWYIAVHHGSASHFDWKSSLPVWNLDTVNFWSNIAFAFTGMELVCAMSEEVRDPQKDLPARDLCFGRNDRRDLHRRDGGPVGACCRPTRSTYVMESFRASAAVLPCWA